MGIALTLLLPSKRYSSRVLKQPDVYCPDRLEMTKDNGIFGQLIKISHPRNDGSGIPLKPSIKSHPLPSKLRVAYLTEDEDGGLLSTRKDGYHEPMRFVYAKDFALLEMPGNASDVNKAIVAFTKAMPPDTPLFLFWH